MTASKIVAAAASGAGGAGLDVDEVFSTFLYDGNDNGSGSDETQIINNGLDLSNEGGLVWIKQRNSGGNDAHFLYDTERGANKYVRTNSTGAEGTQSTGQSSFNNNGFTLTGELNNYTGKDYVSWSFRKAEGFMDIQTWTGNSASDRAIPHNLNTTVGMIIVKRLNSTEDWGVWHRDIHANTTKVMYLNKSDALSTSSSIFGATNPTSTHFYVGDHPVSNNNNDTYVAYIFAHNNNDGKFGPDSDQDIIKCGSFYSDGTGVFPTVDLGFEPQFVLVKSTTSTSWYLLDTLRGYSKTGTQPLEANASAAETTSWGSTTYLGAPTATGFDGNGTGSGITSATVIYMAIRRGPLAVPEDATKVFDVNTYTSTGSAGNKQTTGFPVDLTVIGARGGASWNHGVVSRLTGGDNYLATNSSAAEVAVGAGNGINIDDMTGYDFDGAPFNNDTNMYNLNWKRAPGYFDVVTYTGTGSARTVSHNLGVAPEMIWVKNRDAVKAWIVFHKGLNGGTNPATYAMLLSGTDAEFETASRWNNTAPTSSVFSVGDALQANGSGNSMIAYLFATVAGVSKLGSYTGNGSTQNIDCGFSSGARFVLIKRTNSAGSWWTFDVQRGIVTGNDSNLYLDSTDAEVTSLDLIDPHSSGFALPNAYTNASGDSYIFYAIA